MTPAAEAWSVGAALAPHSFTVTRADLRRYAAASGDPNPVHLEDSAAQAAGFDGVIAHGMLTLALAGRALEEWAGGPGRVRDLRAKFTRPVLVPDDERGAVVQVSGVVRSVDERDDGLEVAIALEVTCGIDTVLGAPRAVVLVPGGPAR
jgi:acyl dehydratase